MAVDIIGLGTPVMDMVLNLPSLPTGDGSLRANDVFYQGGGKVSTAMVACARLGSKAGVIAKVGGNFTGDYIIHDFKHNGVDTSRILQCAPDTSSHLVITLSEQKSQSRTLIGCPSKQIVEHISPGEIDFDYLISAKFLLLENGREASIAAAKSAKENGIPVMLDGDYDAASMEQLLPFVDIFIGSEHYHRERFGDLGIRESCEAILERGPQAAWFTLGARGCVGIADNSFHEIAGNSVSVRDTTGAGDVFHGAYLTALSEGMPHHECARFANAVSAIKCTYAGGRTGIPTRNVVDKFLKENIIDTKELDERLEYYRASFYNKKEGNQ